MRNNIVDAKPLSTYNLSIKQIITHLQDHKAIRTHRCCCCRAEGKLGLTLEMRTMGSGAVPAELT